jgi:large subunit ribosomal protein L15
VINVDGLNAFEDGAVVDLDAILTHGLVSLKTGLLKVLGNGKLERKLTVQAQKFSNSAAEKIRAAGGTVVILDSKGTEVPSGEAQGE